MRKRRYLSGVAVALLIAAIATVIVGIGYYSRSTGAFTISNKSTEPIALATVEICGQKIELHDIAPNAQAAGRYRVYSDDHYRIRVQFASGKTMEAEMGYVTNGFDFQTAFTVTDQKIDMTGHEAR